MIDLGKKQDVNAIRIAGPSRTRVSPVEYWTGEDAMDDQGHGEWKKFESGGVTDGKANRYAVAWPGNARFVRVLMTESSGTAILMARAIAGTARATPSEIYLGTADSQGNFKDLLQHSPDQSSHSHTVRRSIPGQSSDLYVAPDRMESGDQPGSTSFLHQRNYSRTAGGDSGCHALRHSGRSVAQMTYLKQRGYPVWYVEMGEEPDGQYMQPEITALLSQWATALYRADLTLKLGGPVFEGHRGHQSVAGCAGETSV